MTVVSAYHIKKNLKNKNILPDSQLIYNKLYKTKKLINRKKLALIFNISTTIHKNIFYKKLKSMEQNGMIVSQSKYFYTLPEFLKFFTGNIIGHRDGYGFLKTNISKQDMWISIENMKLCIHGDFVLATNSFSCKKNKIETKIIKILKPNIHAIIGQCIIKKNQILVVPYDNRFCFMILIISKVHTITNGSIVSVKLLRRSIRKSLALGQILRVIGHAMNLKLAIKIAIHNYSISDVWNQNIHKELNTIRCTSLSKIDFQNRVDLRHLPFITIDDDYANDFDDAIYCHKINSSTWNIKIAISDVSYYVHPGSALDKEAQKRGNSIYFPSRVVPMLPEQLSINLCSLLPHVDRLVLVCEVKLSTEGKIISYYHYEAIIRSHGRMTYSEIDKIWKGDKLLIKKFNYLLLEFNNLKNLYTCLNQSTEFKKGIFFNIIEPKFVLNTNGKIKNIYLQCGNKVNKLIEFCMILANTVSAMFLVKFHESTLFRDHDPPSINNIIKLKLILKELNVNWLIEKNPSIFHYNHLLKTISHRKDYHIIQLLVLRSLKQAVYDSENRGHFGLSLSAYVHFTSPIRRYSDLLLHRSIKYLLKNHKNYLSKNNSLIGRFHYNVNRISKIGNLCSITERCTDEAVRLVFDWLKCDFMHDKINHSFQGMIVSITSIGCFIRLTNFLIDVFLHISKLNNDTYIFDAQKYMLVGRYTGFKYHLGDILHVCIKSVHMINYKIEVDLLK
ncbi:Ribonuclease R [Buchnera aphidicola (Eriosoma lanigerum)]|uniref:ribonuclease R n=1 Tax=Buchnera aphidicola TaxID=9 RepID=UPI003463DD2B